MTLYDIALDFLMTNGMSDQQAKEVIKMFIEDPDNATTYANRMGDIISDYPKVMRNVLIASIKLTAIKYIDENIPQAWFRPMFLDVEKQQAFMREATAENDLAAERAKQMLEMAEVQSYISMVVRTIQELQKKEKSLDSYTDSDALQFYGDRGRDLYRTLQYVFDGIYLATFPVDDDVKKNLRQAKGMMNRTVNKVLDTVKSQYNV